MNKAELVEAIVKQTKLSKKDAEAGLNAFVDVVKKELANKKGDRKVQLVGFGTFEVRKRAKKQGHNPKTGLPMTIPASKLPAFKAGKGLKDAVR